MSSPTRETYTELDHAYAFFNEHLFGNRLHSCLITLQRQHDTYGYFSPRQFVSLSGEDAHEIALNPSYFAIRPIPETLAVLVREMVSLDQVLHSTSKLPRRRYRNREWADMCEAIGLMPTDTGLPGGRRVGDNIKTYIIAGGPFDVACSKLVDEQFKLSWLDRFPPRVDSDLQSETMESGLAAFAADTLGSETSISVASGAGEGDTAPLASALVASQSASSEGAGDTGRLGIVPHDQSSTGDDSFPMDLAAEVDTAPAPSAAGASVPASAGDADTGPEVAPAAPPVRRFDPVDETVLQRIGVEPREPVKNPSKTRFQCPVCNARAWGKPSLRINCIGSEDEPHDSELMTD